MKISTVTKHLLLVLALSACSSSDDMASGDADSLDAVETTGASAAPADAKTNDSDLLAEVSGDSSSQDLDSMELDSPDTAGKSATASAAKPADAAPAGDEMAAELDGLESGDAVASTTPAPAAKTAPVDDAPLATLGDDATPVAPASGEEAVANHPTAKRSSAGSTGDGGMVYFFDGSQTGANIVGINWQTGYGDNLIKFPCQFNKRKPIKEGEERFGCVISENSANSVIHVHEGKGEQETSRLTKVTIDEKGEASQKLWEENLEAAGYVFHKDQAWRKGLTAKVYLSADHTTHVYLVWNGAENAATLIFKATAKGLGGEAKPVAMNR